MAYPLRQSTASQEVPLGLFVDDTDGKTPETGLSIGNSDIKLHKAGATSLVSKNSSGATHMAGGVYYATLDATDTDTLGGLVAFVNVAGALYVRAEFVVLAAAVYDSLIAASDRLEVDAMEISHDSGAADNLESAADGTGYNLGGGSVVAASVTGAVASVTGAVGSVTGNVGGNVTGSVGSVASGGITAASFAADAITAAKIASDVGTEIAAAVWTALTSGLSTVGSIGKLLVDNVNATISSRADQTSLTDFELDITDELDLVKAKTDNLPSSPAAAGDAMTLTNAGIDGILDRTAGIETNRTLRQGLRLILAATVGKLSGAATTSVAIRDTNDSKDRITATVDANGNRSAVSLDAS